MWVNHKLNFYVILILFIACLFPFSGPGAATYYVDQNDPAAGDHHSGDRLHPFKTVQKGLKIMVPGDILMVKAGRYSLSGYSGNLDGATIIGDGQDTTLLENAGKLSIFTSLGVRGLQFKNSRLLFYIKLSPEQGIDKLSIQECRFDNVQYVLYTSSSSKGRISGVKIIDSYFVDISGTEVCSLCLSHGKVSDINIVNNRFENLSSSQGGCSAIVVGSNANKAFTSDVAIQGNHLDSISGPTGSQARETHGILAYGKRVLIAENEIRNLNPGRDHEAIYLKGSYSTIRGNRVENCGSGPGGADITVKGGEDTKGNQISGNLIISEKQGRGMLINGEASIRDNDIKKGGTSAGISVYAYGKPVLITENRIETQGHCLYVFDASGGEISGNTLISRDGLPIKTNKNITGVVMSKNKICPGSQCSDVPFRYEKDAPQ